MAVTRVSVRPARPGDHETLVELNCRLAEETENKTLEPGLVGPGVAALLGDPRKGRYFVAEVDGAIAGQLMHTFEWSDWRNGQIWWLQSVYVRAPFRRAGVFRALFEHLRAEAEADPEVVAIRLYVEQHNEPARATYARLGLGDAGYLVLERRLRAQY